MIELFLVFIYVLYGVYHLLLNCKSLIESYLDSPDNKVWIIIPPSFLRRRNYKGELPAKATVTLDYGDGYSITFVPCDCSNKKLLPFTEAKQNYIPPFEKTKKSDHKYKQKKPKNNVCLITGPWPKNSLSLFATVNPKN